MPIQETSRITTRAVEAGVLLPSRKARFVRQFQGDEPPSLRFHIQPAKHGSPLASFEITDLPRVRALQASEIGRDLRVVLTGDAKLAGELFMLAWAESRDETRTIRLAVALMDLSQVDDMETSVGRAEMGLVNPRDLLVWPPRYPLTGALMKSLPIEGLIGSALAHQQSRDGHLKGWERFAQSPNTPPGLRRQLSEKLSAS